MNRPVPGKHGGARPGGGRKAQRLSDALLDRIGPPPTDILRQAEWWHRILIALTWDRLHGRDCDELASQVRSNAAAAAKVISHEILYQAKRTLDRSDAELQRDAGPEMVDADDVDDDVVPLRRTRSQ